MALDEFRWRERRTILRAGPASRNSRARRLDAAGAAAPAVPCVEERNEADPRLAAVFGLVAEEFAEMDRLIPRELASGSALVQDIVRHIVNAGGKRLRPLVALLAARASGCRGDAAVRLATIIEFLHTATLLHDDVVDNSARRRGRVSANAHWGNAPSVLVGDFLYSRGFQLMVRLASMEVMAIISHATCEIAEGEVMQLASIGRVDTSERDYREVARRKTAMLFQAAAHTGAVLGAGGADHADHIDALRSYGLRFGMAYQLVDDWLDYAGDGGVMGKNPGDDLAEGKMTLPLIHALRNGRPGAALLIREAVKARSAKGFERVAAVVRESGGLAYTERCAMQEAERAVDALAALPPSPYRDGLETLAQCSVSRLT